MYNTRHYYYNMPISYTYKYMAVLDAKLHQDAPDAPGHDGIAEAGDT